MLNELDVLIDQFEKIGLKDEDPVFITAVMGLK